MSDDLYFVRASGGHAYKQSAIVTSNAIPNRGTEGFSAKLALIQPQVIYRLGGTTTLITRHGCELRINRPLKEPK